MLPSPDWTSCHAQIVAPARRCDVRQETIDDEAILYDLHSGNTLRLNETALVVWHHCDGRTSLKSIARSMVQQYEVDYDTALDHTEQLVAFFASCQLFEPAGSSS